MFGSAILDWGWYRRNRACLMLAWRGCRDWPSGGMFSLAVMPTASVRYRANASVFEFCLSAEKSGRPRDDPTSRYTAEVERLPSGAGLPITTSVSGSFTWSTYQTTASRMTPAGTVKSFRPRQ